MVRTPNNNYTGHYYSTICDPLFSTTLHGRYFAIWHNRPDGALDAPPAAVKPINRLIGGIIPTGSVLAQAPCIVLPIRNVVLAPYLSVVTSSLTCCYCYYRCIAILIEQRNGNGIDGNACAPTVERSVSKLSIAMSIVTIRCCKVFISTAVVSVSSNFRCRCQRQD